MSFETKPIEQISKSPGPKWDLTISIKEVDEGSNSRRLWVTGVRTDAPVHRKQVVMALEFALNMVKNEKWHVATDGLFASAP